MKIVHLCISAFYIDNFSYQENLLSKYHRKLGHDVTVIASLFSFNKEGKGCYLEGPSEYVNSDGVKVIRIDYKKPFYKINKLFRHYEGLFEKIANEKPDIIFSHNISAADMMILRRYLKLHPNVRLYADNHADYINSGKNFLSKHILHPIIWRFFAQKIEPYIQKCYGVTPMRCRFLKEVYRISEKKIGFLPMGVDDDSIPSERDVVRKKIRSELGISDDAILIISGGKIDRLKNIHKLVEAIKSLNNEKIKLILCGVLTPEMDCLKKEFDDKTDVFYYLGWCDAQRVIDCMVASDIACFPGTHSTLWEQSVGIGLPAIFNHWNEMEHVNVNGNCFLINGEDVGEIRQAILTMTDLSNLSHYRELAKEASKSFLYSEIAKKAIEL
ncbi:MAG: glycosyltransferase family 4 protein [Bacteroidaceae bacterium]|nr:glycosyltransferase family 4 protein [Bacteroidaceae bacterium]